MTEPLQPPGGIFPTWTFQDLDETFAEVHDAHVQATLDALTYGRISSVEAIVMFEAMINLAEAEGYRR
jgi:hypothetical protein